MLITDIIGWFGAFFLLLAYFLLTHKTLTGRSKIYQILNVLGAFMLAISNLYTKSFPSLFTNMVWVLIGLYGLFHIVKHIKKNK